MKVVIVDDEISVLHMLEKFLQSKGVECIIIQDPSLAEEIILAENPDLIVLDLKMGPPTGKDLLECLRLKDIVVPIVVASGFLTYAVKGELKRLGVSKILSKPFDISEFEEVLQAHSSSD